jgi:integrase
MFRFAVRHGAVTLNPVREVSKIPTARRTVRALTPGEADRLCDLLRSDVRAVAWDLPDLVEFMLMTGVRIGEACAVRDGVLDLGAGVVEVNATVVRVTGVGLIIQERPKTAAGWRVLALPPAAVEMIRRRDGEMRCRPPHGIVFGSPAGRLRDRSNTAADLRTVLDRLGLPDDAEPGAVGEFGWVHSHVFRKTVATRMDEAGLSARVIADQLGHARPSMTQDVYMGRSVVSAEAAKILDR